MDTGVFGRRVGWTVVFALAVGCAAGPRAPAGGAPAAAPPSTLQEKRQLQPEGPAPTTIEGAQQDIERWRSVLAGGLTPAPTTPGTGTAAPPPPPSPSGATPAPSQPQYNATEPDPCEDPCRAIASMRRSVDVLCRLAGDDDDRCVEARRILSDSEGRVATCGC